MAASVNKTQAEPADVDGFIAGVADETRRADALVLCAIMARISGAPPVMWGPSMIGFGRYHYRYDSGREGEMFRIGFSPRKAETVVYIVPGFDGEADLLGRLGKHRIGKSCLYIKRLDAVDQSVLEELCQKAWDYMAQTYPA